jgi:cell division protein FtsI/penicillin-binding protein 2
VQPKLLDSVLRPNGKPAPSPASRTRRVVSAKTAAQMTKILESVVQKGTGIEAQIPGYAVAGKTGTAQKVLPTGGYGSEHEGTFVGFAPANDPQLVVLVKFDNPSPFWGGTSAAPTFQTIMQFALRHFGVPPSSNAAKAAKAIETSQTGSVPSSGY